MTSQNPTKSDAQPSIPPKNDEIPMTDEQPEVKRELNDDQIASVSGGIVVVGKGQIGTPFNGMSPY
ncbi:MAG: hypothetical protein ACLQGP_39210 [Isosphaeraceae bacterium]